MKSTIHVLLALVLITASAVAQEAVIASAAELSVPFGAATGQLVTVADHLVFVNQERPDDSFSINKPNIFEATFNAGLVTIQTREAVGGLSRFTFRLLNPAKVAAVTAWAKQAPVTMITPAQGGAAESPAVVIGEYQVRHQHLIRGACNGKLVITNDRVSFESVSEIGHSRQWDIADIKELRRPNPYRLEIRPFVGNDYTFNLVGGEGMSSREYKALADRVAEARIPR